MRCAVALVLYLLLFLLLLLLILALALRAKNSFLVGVGGLPAGLSCLPCLLLVLNPLSLLVARVLRILGSWIMASFV